MKFSFLFCRLSLVLCLIGCQSVSSVKHKRGYRQHTLTMKNLGPNLKPFINTSYDFFNSDRAIRRLTQQAPMYIHYHTFRLKKFDRFNLKVQILYARYHFVVKSLQHFKKQFQAILGQSIEGMKFDTVKEILSHPRNRKLPAYQKLSLACKAFEVAVELSRTLVKEGMILRSTFNQIYQDGQKELKTALERSHLKDELKQEKQKGMERLKEVMIGTPKVVPLLAEVSTYLPMVKEEVNRPIQKEVKKPESPANEELKTPEGLKSSSSSSKTGE